MPGTFLGSGGVRARHARLLALAAAALLAAGCGTMDPRRDASFQSKAHQADRPAVRPMRSISSFSDSLACMDQMLRSTELSTTLIASKQIPDFSGRVAVATKDMVVTALSQMSRLSNAFRYVDYEVDIARQDTVQNLTTLLLNTNQVQLQRPALYISGAISFADQNVLNNRSEAGASGSRLDLGYSRSRNATIIGLEMHLGDFRTRTLIPGMDSANEVVIGTGGEGLDVAGRISDYGVQFNVGRDYTQGAGAAVRTLVELATIELVGKWARLPYWQCLTLEQTHPDFQRQLRDWYGEGEPGVHAQLVKRSLISRGYLGPQGEQLDTHSPGVRDALARFQADSGMVPSGVIDFPTYERALRNFVGLGPDGKLVRVGWSTTSATPLVSAMAAAAPAAAPAPRPGQAAAPQRQPPVYGAPALPRTLDMQIENPKADRGSFETGEQVFLSAAVSRASYLSCYFSDERGAVMRLLPNSTNRATWVAAHQAVRIPDWMSPTPGFILDAGAPGAEALACFATDTDDPTRLPEALQGPALRPLAGFNSLEQVNQAYAQAFGAAGYTANRVRWQVVPGRGPAAANGQAAPAK